jgi:hypothetical protein
MKNNNLFKMARQIIYGENPIGVITRMGDNSLDGLQDYAMKGTDPGIVKQLNGDDAWLLAMLTLIETNRRYAASTNEFLVYLQGRAEWLAAQPKNGRTGRAEGWVQAYDLLIRSRRLSVRNPTECRKYESGETVTR